MPYFQDQSGKLHFLSDADIANGGIVFLPQGTTPITDEQAAALQAPTQGQLWAAYQTLARASLAASDAVATRCVKAGVSYPANWLAYDDALRTIVRATSGDPTQPLPTAPAYPSGT